MTHLQKIKELTKKIEEIQLEISQEKAYLSGYISKESNCINNSFKVGDIVKLKQTFEHLHNIYDCLVDAKKLIVSRLSNIIAPATVWLNNEKGEDLGCWNYDRFELVERPLKKTTGSTVPQGFKKGDIIRLREDYSGLDASNIEIYKHGIEYTVACDEYQIKDVIKENNNNYVIDLVQPSISMIYSEQFELVRFVPKFKKGMTVRWKNPKSYYMIYIVEEDSYYRNFDRIEVVVTNGGTFPVNNVEEVEIKIKES